MADKTVDEKVLSKIGKLLKLAESPNEAEAMSAMEKAHALLAEYNLDMQDIKEPQEILEGTASTRRAQLPRWKNICLIAAGTLNYCSIVEERKHGYRETVFEHKIYGRAANIEATKLFYAYLMASVERLYKEASKSRQLQRNQYCQAMAIGLHSRIKSMMIRENNTEHGLVCVSKEADDYVKKHVNPKTQKIKVTSGGTSAMCGAHDAERVNLNQQLQGKTEARMAIQ